MISLKKISVFFSLPFSIRKKIVLYYLHRVTFLKATDNEIIWTSFFYFTLQQSVRVHENESGYLIEFSYHDKPLRVLVRKNESSDIYVFFQVFIRDEYSPFFKCLKALEEAPKICMDAGANVGYFTLAMGCWFPASKIFPVEPDYENYEVLLTNLTLNNMNEFVVPIHAALWVENKKLFLKRQAVQEWAYAVTEEVTADGECEALTLNKILNDYGLDRFCAIKIDVEGAEQHLFSDQSFLDHIQLSKIIGLEIHDGKANRKEIQNTLRELHYSISEHGELTLAKKSMK